MMRQCKRIFSGMLILLICSCATKKPLIDMDDDHAEWSVPLSVLPLPVRLHKAELERDLNRQLGTVLYEDNDLKDDDLAIRAERSEDIRLQIDERQIEYRVPLKIWVKKNLRLTNVEAEGTLAINFRTEYQIREDWSLQTTTEVTSHEWIRKPVLKLGVIDLPIQFIANQVLKSSRQTIAKAIDEQVRANLDLRAEVESAWNMLQDPLLLSEEYHTWMVLHPSRLFMTPLQSNVDTIESTIVLLSEPRVYLGEEPARPEPRPLPSFTWQESDQGGFAFVLQTEIPFVEAERLAQQNMVGERFSSGKRYVVVEDIRLTGRGNRLVVATDLSGSYNGRVNLIGKPVYDARSGRIELRNLDVELETRNFLYKSLGWLFKGAFKKRVQENLNYYLEYYLDTMRETIQQEFDHFALAPGVELNGELEDLRVQQVYVTTDAIRTWVGLGGKIEVDVHGLSQGATEK